MIDFLWRSAAGALPSGAIDRIGLEGDFRGGVGQPNKCQYAECMHAGCWAGYLGGGAKEAQSEGTTRTTTTAVMSVALV